MLNIYGTNLGSFTKGPANKKLVDHIVNTYLPVKFANYLGISRKRISNNTMVKIPSGYANDEGVIINMDWIGNTRISGLRIDLQHQTNTPANPYNSKRSYATWQVQYGTGNQNNDRGGAYAGVLVKTDIDVPFGDIWEAMQASFMTLDANSRPHYAMIDVAP